MMFYDFGSDWRGRLLNLASLLLLVLLLIVGAVLQLVPNAWLDAWVQAADAKRQRTTENGGGGT